MIRPSLVVLALLTAPLAAQSVLVVDAFDPAAYATMQAAVNAAASGDVILVRTPQVGFTDGYFEVSGKSLVLQADTGFAPYFYDFAMNNHSMDFQSTHTRIHDLQPGQRVVLRGLSFGGLELASIDGQVWLEDATVNFVSPAMRATDVDDLVLHAVQGTGPSSSVDPYFWQVGGGALELLDARAALHAVTLQGGHGHMFTCSMLGFCSNASGRSALVVNGGSAWLAGASLAGGNGGQGGTDLVGFCFPGGSGGDGLQLADGAVTARDVAATGGTAAPGPAPESCQFGDGGDGVPGQPLHVISGTLDQLAGEPLGLQAASPVREGETLSVTLSGLPGTEVLLLAGLDSAQLSISAVHGPLLTGVPTLVLSLGALPAGGALELHATVPELGAGVQAVSWTLQAISREGGEYFAGPGSTLLLLDGGI